MIKSNHILTCECFCILWVVVYSKALDPLKMMVTLRTGAAHGTVR
ncbi:hypothetical protein ALT785_380016 [Alteromonas infernus]